MNQRVQQQSTGATASSDRARRETGVLAAGVTAVPLVVASSITVLPQLGGLWPTCVGIAVVLAISAALTVAIVRSARSLLVGESADSAIVKYTDDRETGILEKGDIENVSLRVSTIHKIVDTLTLAIPADRRQDALYKCGYEIGRNWAAEFRRQLPRIEIPREDIFRQLLKWSEYDATAGMGRLTVAVNPVTGDGVITLSNGFLSRSEAHFPLNWWFAGYLSGTLRELIERPGRVEIVDPSPRASKAALFRVIPDSPDAQQATPSRPIHKHSVARGKVWIRKLRQPLPDEF